MKTLNVAVVGVGAMGANHARIYNELAETNLVGVCDPDKKTVNELAKKYGCRAYNSHKKLLKDLDLDAVSIATPTQFHTQIALDFMSEGVTPLIEKPIADTPQNAEKIIKAAKKHDIKPMIGHIERFNPAINELKNRLKKKKLGKIFSMNATRVGPFPHRIRDVGVVIDLAVHDIDIMRYISGEEVQHVYAQTEKKIHTKHEDMLTSLMKFTGQVSGVLEVNWLTPEKIRQITVTGEKGMFKVNYIPQQLMFYENSHANNVSHQYSDLLMGVTEGDITEVRIRKQEPLKNEIRMFAQAVAQGENPPVTAEDGLKALTVAQAIINSANTNTVKKIM